MATVQRVITSWARHWPSGSPRGKETDMSVVRWGLLALTLLSVGGCNAERKQECDKFLAATKPLDQGTPTVEMVESVKKQIGAIQFTDQTLGIYAKNYDKTLGILSGTLQLKASPNPPDGTDDVIKKNLKSARTDASDVQRYCAQ
jgi:hypothetical protein